MGKADNKNTPEPLPHDDPRWRPIEAAYRRRFEQTENIRLSIFQLNDVLQKGQLPSKEQSVSTGKSRLIPSTEWTNRIGLGFWRGNPRVFYRERRMRLVARQPRPVLVQARDFQFFVWWPIFETLWSTAVTDHIDTKITPVAPDTPAADQPPKITPQAWFNKALENYPRRRGEKRSAYYQRLLTLLNDQKPNLTKPLEPETLRRNVYRVSEDEPVKTAQKVSPPTAKR